jgi:hypothetical protein
MRSPFGFLTSGFDSARPIPCLPSTKCTDTNSACSALVPLRATVTSSPQVSPASGDPARSPYTMRASATLAYVTAILSAITVVLATLPTSANATLTDPSLRATLYAPRDGHGHSHGTAGSGPLVELNETEVLLWHAATPPSYYTADFEGEGVGPDQTRYPGLMGLHVGLMCFAFFIALPAGACPSGVPYSHSWS